MKLLNHDVRVLAKKTASEVLDDNILGLSAETAYNFFFGLFPLLLFAGPLLSLVGDREALFNDILGRLAPSMPLDAFLLVQGVLRDVVFTKNAPGLMSLGALLALWAGAGMFSSLMSALNTAYDVSESRPWWRQKLTAVVCAIGSIIILLSATTVMLAGEQIVAFVTRLLHLGPFGEVVWTIVQYLLAFTLVVAVLGLLYFILPNVQQGLRSVIPGAIFAALFWVLFTFLFRLYVTNFGSYNKTYGTIGAVIVLLTWMYWTSFAILTGGELNSELHAGTGAAAGPDTGLRSGRVATHDGLPHSSAQPR
jgi:membrane protein